jgi:hypothetical protein
MKERCEKLNAEKQILNSQLEKQSIDLAQEQDKQIKGNFYSFSYHFK